MTLMAEKIVGEEGLFSGGMELHQLVRLEATGKGGWSCWGGGR